MESHLLCTEIVFGAKTPQEVKHLRKLQDGLEASHERGLPWSLDTGGGEMVEDFIEDDQYPDEVVRGVEVGWMNLSG